MCIQLSTRNHPQSLKSNHFTTTPKSDDGLKKYTHTRLHTHTH